MNKTRVNKVYRGGRLYSPTYHGKQWTTNTHIAEAGVIEPRVYKDTADMRQQGQQPILDSIIDNPVTVEPVTAAVETTEDAWIVTTDNYNYDYNATYISYLVDKYGMHNLLLEPLGKTSKIYAQDGNGNTVAVLMGLSK